MNSHRILLQEIEACTACIDKLDHRPRPVVQLHPNAKILIAGQAPGRKVHETGIPFNDASGDRLREWMGIDKDVFYNPEQVAILPMGFCYPGTGKSGDLPPIPECARLWRERCMAMLSNVEIALVVGKYAQDYHFGSAPKSVSRVSLTDRVKSWQAHWPDKVPLPHPSPRNNIWLSKNAWFEAELVPALQARIVQVLSL